jgi:hypothetical protein
LLDAEWGTGKTTFVKMWLGELAKAGVPTIYFDAFANDYHDDAFLTVAGEIVARAEELKPKSKRALRQFKDSAVGVAKTLGRASVRIGIRTASAGLLTGDELIEGVKIAADAAKAANPSSRTRTVWVLSRICLDCMSYGVPIGGIMPEASTRWSDIRRSGRERVSSSYPTTHRRAA